MGYGITGKMTDMKFLWVDRTSSRGPQICCVFFWSRSREATGISTEQGIVFFCSQTLHHLSMGYWEVAERQHVALTSSSSSFYISFVSCLPFTFTSNSLFY